MNRAKLITLLVAIFCSVPGAYAATVYTYTGNPFTDRTGTLGDIFSQMTISLTFVQPLGPGTSDDTLLDWEISDRASDLKPKSGAVLNGCQLVTDTAGNIVGWLINAALDGGAGDQFQHVNYISMRAMDPEGSVIALDEALLFDTEYQLSTASVAVSGTWTEHTLVPEPSYSALVLVALAAGFAWRRKRARA